MFADRLCEPRCIGEIGFDERAPLDRFGMAVDEAVEHNRAVTRGMKSFARVASDVAGAACDEDIRWHD